MVIDKDIITRNEILKCLKRIKCHPCCKKVYFSIKKKFSFINLEIVQKGLNELVCEGKIIRLDVNGDYRYDCDISNHLHCVCKICSRITEIFDENIVNQVNLDSQSEDFVPNESSPILHGYCNKCLGKRKL